MLVADRSRRALLTVIPQAAESVIADGMDAGLWVLLLNVHLVPQWLPRLHGIVAAISSESTHKDFRLIVTTTASCTAFPFSFVQNCTAARRSCFCIAWCAAADQPVCHRRQVCFRSTCWTARWNAGKACDAVAAAMMYHRELFWRDAPHGAGMRISTSSGSSRAYARRRGSGCCIR